MQSSKHSVGCDGGSNTIIPPDKRTSSNPLRHGNHLLNAFPWNWATFFRKMKYLPQFSRQHVHRPLAYTSGAQVLHTCPCTPTVNIQRRRLQRTLTTVLLWKLPKVSRVVLILVVDNVPVRLVGLDALRRQQEQVFITITHCSERHGTLERVRRPRWSISKCDHVIWAARALHMFGPCQSSAGRREPSLRNDACVTTGWRGDEMKRFRSVHRHFRDSNFQWRDNEIYPPGGVLRRMSVKEGKTAPETFHFPTTRPQKKAVAIYYRKGSVSPPTSLNWGECFSYLLRKETSVHCYSQWWEHLEFCSGEICTVSRNPLSGMRNAIRNVPNSPWQLWRRCHKDFVASRTSICMTSNVSPWIRV